MIFLSTDIAILLLFNQKYIIFTYIIYMLQIINIYLYICTEYLTKQNAYLYLL